MNEERRFDVVVYGATGFTGGLVAEYLARHRPPGLRWALAGRDLAKLEAVRSRVAALDATASELPLVRASSDDAASLAAMAASTRVVLTTVGPYARYGEPLVAACVANGADYVDITGEPAFVDMTLERYDEPARAARVRIVSCCGFDSIPHDLGAHFTAEQLPSDAPMTIRGFVRSRADFSGGTWHSAIGAFAGFGMPSRASRPKSNGARRVRALPMRIAYEPAIGAWGVPLPTIDGPVVLRSARALDLYGPDFRYGHFAAMKHLPTVAAAVTGAGALLALAKVPVTRSLLLRVRDPGEGPDEATRARGWFEVTFLGESASGARVRTRVAGGDPGYGETSKMIAESALCLALDRAKLAPRYGVLTTASAMGDTLRERLVRAGMKFEVLDRA